jgi:hypothetical protein
MAIGSLAGGVLTTGTAAAAAAVTVPESAVASVQQLVQSHPDAYTGISVDEKQHLLRVFAPRAGVSAAGETLTHLAAGSLRVGTGGPLRVEVLAQPYSLRQLNATMARIDVAEPWATASRNMLTSWFADPASGRVRVGLTEVTAQLRQLAHDAFGDQVELFAQDRFNAAVRRDRVDQVRSVKISASRSRTGTGASPAVAPTRLLDATPYYSGTRIFRTYVQDGQNWVIQCTTAFAVASGSNRQMVTAGHCGASGLVWTQGYLDSAGTLHYTGTMGTTGHVEWGNNRMDAEVLGGGSYWSGAVYTGPSNSSLAYGVSGTTSLAVGQSVCSDGSFTGENCGVRIGAINSCLNLNDNGTVVKVCNQAQGDATGPSYPIVQHGDSGGPVYKLAANPNYTLAAGIISGGNDAGTHMNFTQFTNFTSTVAVSIVTGSPA